MLPINSIYHLDCFKFLNKINDGSIDLAVIDPPYNMRKAEWDTFVSETDFFQWTFSWIDALLPKLKQTGSVYIFNTPYNSAFILQHLSHRKLIFQNWITWDKRDGLGSSKRKYSNGQETILFFTKSKKYTFNYDDIRVPYESTERIDHAAKKGILKNGKRWFPNPNGRFCGEVWHFPSERHVTKVNGKVQKLPHITPKPLAMIERIIKASSNIGDIVLDCFIGSGTTAIAAKKLERNFIGADSNLSYIKLAQQKINHE
ncbi:MAG: site-specific DNA-methyltransferase [Planctomycetaceae bacterium]|jgi:site-specific DNA-methyltransferase (adenine-specific)|nr:site-specific DNA-methyltransferase [Planctomycetaceae bacterium]